MSNCNGTCDGCKEGENCKIKKITTNSYNKIKHIVGIISGKGGVGKSFVTSLLASKLNKLGYKVGILDGDITGPSIPKSFNIHEQAYGDKDGLIFPAITKSNIKIISSSMLLENEEDPIIWRSSLINTLLKQFYTDVRYGELDYLLIDMPPGTSDPTLTLFQSFPLDGVIIVTSPQDLVSLIVNKAIKMANTMNIKILGLIENMAYVKCPNCNEKIYLYGKGKTNEFAKKNNIELLTSLPIITNNSSLIDEGNVEQIELEELDIAVNKLLERIGK